MKFYALLLIILIFPKGIWAKARDYIHIANPLNIQHDTISKSVHVNFFKPCGAKIKGLFFQPQLKAWGVLLVLPTNSCLGLPTLVTQKIPIGFTNSKPPTLKPLQRHLRGNFSLKEVVITGQKDILIDRKCNNFAGIFLSPGSQNQIKIAAVESKRLGSKNCERKKKLKIPLAHLEPVKLSNKLRSMRVSALKPRGRIPYRLKISPFLDRTATLKHGKLRFVFQRKCDEAPVGVTLSHGGHQTYIGVLSAKVPGPVCHATYLENIELSGLQIRNSGKFSNFPESQTDAEYGFISPEKIISKSLPNRSKIQEFQLLTRGSSNCYHRFLPVFRSTDKNSVAVGFIGKDKKCSASSGNKRLIALPAEIFPNPPTSLQIKKYLLP